MLQITFAPTFTAWQVAARRALGQDFNPAAIHWEELSSEQPGLAMFDEAEPATRPAEFRVPKGFLEIARKVACHRESRRWALLYRVLWRLTHGEPRLLEVVVDSDMHELLRMEKAVRHDVHKMRAFVRFRRIAVDELEWYVAWFEPEHHIVELNSAFFADRFASMRWSILTPERCVHWDAARLTFTTGVSRSEAPTEDSVESLWIQYYSHIFNPGRVKVHAMQSEMPKKYWKNLPEAAVIPALLEQAPRRVAAMMTKSEAKRTDHLEWHPAEPPATQDLGKLREAAAGCKACPLFKNATQTVFGEGPSDAQVVFVGEQPGDQEDLQEKPFVGPAGQLFDRALVKAGIDRATVYVTNTVKHFKWEPQGKRRLHKTPNSRDIAACRPWLEAELASLQPRLLVALGSTAAAALAGPDVRVTRDRGRIIGTAFCERTVLTVHPSSLLRTPDEESRRANYELFIADLRFIAAEIAR